MTLECYCFWNILEKEEKIDGWRRPWTIASVSVFKYCWECVTSQMNEMRFNIGWILINEEEEKKERWCDILFTLGLTNTTILLF